MKKIIILAGFLGILGGATTSVFAGYFSITPTQRCNTQIVSTLEIGSESNDVTVLQNMLTAGGYLYVQPNGYFGPSTKAAVKRFQSANGISATGIVGESTRNAINERLCDADVRGDSLSYNVSGYASGITYVDQYDPYAIVISPKSTTPLIYTTPQENVVSFSNTSNIVSTSNVNASVSSSYYPPVLDQLASLNNVVIPASTQIQSAGIIYNPSVGYVYSIVPKSGSLTILSPVNNSVYKEGDTIMLTWGTDNLNATGFQVLLENTSTGQSKQVAFTRTMNVSFVLTKDLLDAVCAGACDNNQQGSFKIVIATPVTDIAGITSNFRAAVSPLTIKRPYSISAAVSLTTSKQPVDSGEKFRLYVNTPLLNSFDTYTRENTNVRIHAICVNNTQVSIAGVPCGQDFTMPLSIVASQSGIPTMITNATWYKQNVIFEVVLTDKIGQIIGTSRTTVAANPAPFNW